LSENKVNPSCSLIYIFVKVSVRSQLIGLFCFIRFPLTLYSQMEEIKFTVEETKTGYSAYAKIDGGIAVTTGVNLTELKSNALN
jgi:hypothetical protein